MWKIWTATSAFASAVEVTWASMVTRWPGLTRVVLVWADEVNVSRTVGPVSDGASASVRRGPRSGWLPAKIRIEFQSTPILSLVASGRRPAQGQAPAYPLA